ncbi:hypothetical protein NLU13_8876 [Sarocladium strictum]|uniref:G-protein coupled receptors family 1 profile domain-containing protein n=1 Tax=Sarocladium strictum TaxID=5046 RepID=A0AA39G948_SARSR|nr:hypothetical protein NLU13_8876 [Sarocladium strictum]
MAVGELAVVSQSLNPLTPSLHQGLTAITVLALISFTGSTCLCFYLGYKLVAWHFFLDGSSRVEEQQQQHQQQHHHSERSGRHGFQRTVDFALGIDGVFTDNSSKQAVAGTKMTDLQTGEEEDTTTTTTTKFQQSRASRTRRKKSPPNQFLVLVFNLLLADMHQATAFLLNVAWLRHDGIQVGTATCFTQGLFVSLGDLASSCFITSIAVHTYLAVVHGAQPSQNALYVWIGLTWFFVYAISLIPIIATKNGAQFGGFFVRAGAWCWMNTKYEILRLVTHYLFIFIAIGTTSILYLLIFLFLRRRARQLLDTDPKAADDDERTETELQLTRNPAFLIYPVIYVLCTLPLALGRIATMAGADVPLGYFCFAGAMIASNGTFDCLLFGTTRNVIIFASRYDTGRSEVGLATFRFLHNKGNGNRRFGNFIFIQGGGGGRQRPQDHVAGGWWSWQRLAGRPDETLHHHHHHKPTRSISQEALRGPAIQMDTVTSVVVETDHDKDRDVRYPDPNASASPSLSSGGENTNTTRGY